MSSTAGDEGQGGQFGAKEVRTRGLLLAAIFLFIMQYSETGGMDKALLVFVGKVISDFTHKCHEYHSSYINCCVVFLQALRGALSSLTKKNYDVTMH